MVTKISIARSCILSAVFLLMVSTLFYPLGYDQSVFSIGGEMMLRFGAIPFRDIIDTKPPLIFIIYGVASLVFGHHEWSIRVFDVLYHVAALFYLYRLLHRTTRDERLAFGSAIIYAALYFISTFIMMGQVESFALLPVLVLYDVAERAAQNSHPIRNGLIGGLATTILLLLKPTFIVVPIASVLYLCFFSDLKSWKVRSLFSVGLLLGTVASLGSIVIYLSSIDALTEAAQWVQWVRGYSQISDQSIQEGFYRIFPIGFMSAFGLSTIAIGSLGGYLVSRMPSRMNTYAHLTIQFTLGCVAILIERKYFPYHYIRLFWAASPFIYIGFYELWRRTKPCFSQPLQLFNMKRLIGLAGIITIVLYSFIPRLFIHPFHWVQARLSGADVAAEVQSQYTRLVYKDQMVVADSLRPILQPTDEIYIWGHDVAIYYWLDRYRMPYGVPNAPFVTSWSPSSWKQSLLSSLRNTPPRFFICEFDDIRTYITGDTLDSYQYLQQWSELNSFVNENYEPWKTIGKFHIFERR